MKENTDGGKPSKVSSWNDVPDEIKNIVAEVALSPFDRSPEDALYDAQEAQRIKELYESVPGVRVIQTDFNKVTETTLADGRKVALSHVPIVAGNENLSRAIEKKNLKGNNYLAGPDISIQLAFDQHTSAEVLGYNLHPDAPPGVPFDYIQVGAAASPNRKEGNPTSFVDIIESTSSDDKPQIYFVKHDEEKGTAPIFLTQDYYKAPKLDYKKAA